MVSVNGVERSSLRFLRTSIVAHWIGVSGLSRGQNTDIKSQRILLWSLVMEIILVLHISSITKRKLYGLSQGLKLVRLE